MTAGLKVGAVFCFLNAVCAFFVSLCFKKQITSLAVPAVLNGWDSNQKAQACTHAGFLYIGAAVLLLLRIAYVNWLEWQRSGADASSMPLLSPSSEVVGYDAAIQSEPSHSKTT